MTKGIDDMIKDMETANGPIAGVAALAQTLKGAMRGGRNWDGMPPEAKELLEQAATKLARILNGDAADPSHWNGAAACLRLRAMALGNPEPAKAEVSISQLERRMRTIPNNQEPAT